ncbi:MAG: hypothetical protein ACJAUP_000527 [Cellvibrionaceae bacterium]|jgi:hypothetical protein
MIYSFFTLLVRLWIASIIFVLVGCNVTADEKTATAAQPIYLQELAWANSADAEKDARKAFSKKDYRLYIVAGRGERVVGVDSAQAKDLKQLCGTQYIQGSTDVVRGDQHMEALKKAYDYAEKYNQIVVKHCLD